MSNLQQIKALKKGDSISFADWGKTDHAVRQMLYRLMVKNKAVKYRCFGNTKTIFREV